MAIYHCACFVGNLGTTNGLGAIGHVVLIIARMKILINLINRVSCSNWPQHLPPHFELLLVPLGQADSVYLAALALCDVFLGNHASTHHNGFDIGNFPSKSWGSHELGKCHTLRTISCAFVRAFDAATNLISFRPQQGGRSCLALASSPMFNASA